MGRLDYKFKKVVLLVTYFSYLEIKIYTETFHVKILKKIILDPTNCAYGYQNH